MTSRLTVSNGWFVDEKGRRVLLRGVNVGGSSKVPARPNGATHIKTDFRDHRDVSYIGRPFPLSEAESHLRRIKHWGFNCLRFLVTWEAIEHRGPGDYDKEYLEYLQEILKIAEEFKLHAFIDPHQDVWSRMCGGDGAPGWTLEKVGLDLTKFDASEAAFLMQRRYNPNDPKAYPPMSWPQNKTRFAAANMWTLFFGGKDFAPSCLVEGQNVQDYLQEHYFNALKQVAAFAKDMDYVLGFDTLNEPDQGWIGAKVDGSNVDLSTVIGYGFTPMDAMATASGFPRTVGYREIKRFGVKETRKDIMNAARVSVWLKGCPDIWRTERIWDLERDQPRILNNDHFMKRRGVEVDFVRDYLSPFVNRVAKEIRTVMPHAIVFYEGSTEKTIMGQPLRIDVPPNSVHAAHWYDVGTIGTKRFMEKASYDIAKGTTVIGPGNVAQMFVRQLKGIGEGTAQVSRGVPTLIGEFGLCYDLDQKSAYGKLKTDPLEAWKTHERALSKYYNALDASLLNSTQWDYTSDNTNEWGDQWNLEDFSIFSVDQLKEPDDINSGGRAIRGFCRPHFITVAGTPTRMKFDMRTGSFVFDFDADPSVSDGTTIYLPDVQYPEGFTIRLSEGRHEYDKKAQVLHVYTGQKGIHSVSVSREHAIEFGWEEDEEEAKT
ncbi:MAG: glycosyl hydrolase family 5 [Candidatus Thorarchaeota archaeon]|nr:MAG: glycosyl hydrolase family 5 [Candidatus Thorarchaeota archaeon]